MNQRLTYILPMSAILAASCSGGEAQKASDLIGQRPNVVFIYADDIGIGDLSCYGTSAVPTPNSDRIAEEGIRFTNAHCAAATSTPSRYAMLTGEYAWRREGTGIAAGDAAMIITPERYTLADMFKSAGYSTAVVGKWHLGLGDKTGAQNWNEEVSPNTSDIGFDYSYIMAATGDRTPCIFMENGLGVGLDPADPVYVSYKKNFEGEPTGKNNPEMLKLHPSHGHDQALVNGVSRIGYMKGGEAARWDDQNIADSITMKAVQFIERESAKDEPFFLYFATNDVHVPRVPHDRFVGKSGLGARGDALLSFDWSVGEVLSTLERLGLDENTIVILSSDNGMVLDDGYKDGAVELLGDHKPSGVHRGGKYSSFEAGTRVPCMIRWSGRIAAGEISSSLMSQVDLFSTLATLVDTTIPEGAAPDSESHLDSWVNSKAKGREYFVAQNVHNKLSITNGEWKYIPSSNGPAISQYTNMELGNNPEDQLYNLSIDPGETLNIADKYPDVVSALAAKLKEIEEK